MELNNFDSYDDCHSQKSKDKVAIKNSTKKGSQSSDMATKTIQQDSSLLMPERVESGQVEYDACNHAKLNGAIHIQHSLVTSDPNTTNNIGRSHIPTQSSEHAKNVLGAQPGSSTSKDNSSSTN